MQMQRERMGRWPATAELAARQAFPLAAERSVTAAAGPALLSLLPAAHSIGAALSCPLVFRARWSPDNLPPDSFIARAESVEPSKPSRPSKLHGAVTVSVLTAQNSALSKLQCRWRPCQASVGESSSVLSECHCAVKTLRDLAHKATLPLLLSTHTQRNCWFQPYYLPSLLPLDNLCELIQAQLQQLRTVGHRMALARWKSVMQIIRLQSCCLQNLWTFPFSRFSAFMTLISNSVILGNQAN